MTYSEKAIAEFDEAIAFQVSLGMDEDAAKKIALVSLLSDAQNEIYYAPETGKEAARKLINAAKVIIMERGLA